MMKKKKLSKKETERKKKLINSHKNVKKINFSCTPKI